MDIVIQNTQECFVALWRELERTRQRFDLEYKRFCIRRILKDWLGAEATDDLIWEVCFSTLVEEENEDEPEHEQQYGYDELPPPTLQPRKSREFLRALVATKLGIGMRQVALKDLDAAYSIAFPKSTEINVRKRKNRKALAGWENSCNFAGSWSRKRSEK